MSMSPFAEIDFYLSDLYMWNETQIPISPAYNMFFQSERTGHCVGVAEWAQVCFDSEEE